MSNHCDADVLSLSGGLLPYVQEKASKAMIPLNVFMEITLQCNIRCQHCYNFDREQAMPSAFKNQALSPDEIRRVIREVHDAGCLFLYFTGGEALLHPHLLEFVQYAGALNMAVQILSNGTMIDEAMIDRFQNHPNLNGFSISVYGASAAVHDGITQSSGSYEKTIHAITLLKDAGYRVHMKYIIMQENAHELQAGLQLADDLGLACYSDMTVTGRHNNDASSLGRRIDSETFVTLLQGPLQEMLPDAPRQADDANWKCNCAQGTCAITATGEVQPCISVPWSGGNVRERSFQEIWVNSPVFQGIRNLTVDDYTQCVSCADRAYCYRAPGGAYLASGDYTGVDPWFCRNAESVHRIVRKEQLL